MLKKSILIIMVIIISSSCCISNQGSDSSTTGEPKPGEQSELKYTILVFQDYLDDWESFDEELYTEAWEKLIYEKFNVDIQLQREKSTNINNAIDIIVASDCFEGLVRIPPDITRKEVIDSNLYYNLTDFVVDNECWKSLPSFIRESNIINGNLWALPAVVDDIAIGFNVRLLNKKYFKENFTNSTIDRFYEECLSIKEECVPIYISSGSGISDIYNSFGIYTDYSLQTLGWNSDLGEYQSIVYNCNFKNCINWLRLAYGSGLINEDFRESYNSPAYSVKFDEREIGSFLSSGTYLYSKYQSQYFPLLNLKTETGLNKIVYTIPSSGYLIPKSCTLKKAESIANSFIDIFWGNDEGKLMGLYGLPENSMYKTNYKNEDNNLKIIYNYNEENGTASKELNISILASTLNTISDYNIILESSSRSWNNENSYSTQHRNDFFLELTSKFIQPVIHSRRFPLYSEQYCNYNEVMEIEKYTNNCIFDYIAGDISFEDSYIQITNEYKKTGLEELLEIINQSFHP